MSRWAYNMARETVRGLESLRRAREADERRALRDAIRAQRDAQRQALRDYQGSRQNEAEELTRSAEARFSEIRSILKVAQVASSRDWRSLVRLDHVELPTFVPPARLDVRLQAPRESDYRSQVKELWWPLRVLPIFRRMNEERIEIALFHFKLAQEKYRRLSERQQQELQAARHRFDEAAVALRARIADYNAAADSLHDQALGGEPASLASIVTVALSTSSWGISPEIVPTCWACVDTVARAVVVDIEVPEPTDVVPDRSRFRYIKKNDELREAPTSDRQKHLVYREYLAGLVLAAVRGTLTVCAGTPIESVEARAWRGPAEDGRCLASLQVRSAQRQECEGTDYEAWALFKELKGLMAAKPADESLALPARSIPEDAANAADDLLAKRYGIEEGIRAFEADRSLPPSASVHPDRLVGA